MAERREGVLWIAPTTIKKALTGSGKASKADVASSLAAHVGALDYACDDESDSVAVGVAWLIKEECLCEGEKG